MCVCVLCCTKSTTSMSAPATSGNKKSSKRNSSAANLENEQQHIPPQPAASSHEAMNSARTSAVSSERSAQIAADAEMVRQLETEANTHPMPAVTFVGTSASAQPAAAAAAASSAHAVVAPSSSSSTPVGTPERKPFKRVRVHITQCLRAVSCTTFTNS
jgi:hypothetical protein